MNTPPLGCTDFPRARGCPRIELCCCDLAETDRQSATRGATGRTRKAVAGVRQYAEYGVRGISFVGPFGRN